MRVLFVNSLYPTAGDSRAIGGAETFSVRLVKGLLDAGHDVRIVRSGMTLAGGVEHIDGGIEVHSMPCRNVYPMLDGRAHGAVTRAVWHLLEDRGRVSPAFRSVLDSVKPDIVHTNNIAGITTDIWRVARAARLPILHTLHDYYLICPKVMRYARGGPCVESCMSCSVLSRQRRRAVHNVDRVIGVSQRMLDIHCQEGLFVDTPSEVILNMPPPRREAASIRLRPLGQRPVFGFIGRQAPEKGIYELLEAFVKLAPGSASLVIAGAVEPTVLNWVKQNAPRPDDVVFTGFTTHEAFFPNVDVAVIPSIWEEPCSMGAGEAFSFGVPALGSNRGGIPEMLEDGRLGWLFEPGSNELATLMTRLVENPADITNKARTVQQRMLNDTGDRLVASYIDAYTRVLDQPRHGKGPWVSARPARQRSWSSSNLVSSTSATENASS